MKSLILFLTFFFAPLVAKENLSIKAPSLDPIFEGGSKEELLITELDDMKNLFPFSEKLDPKDPALCIETIAKQQQESFVSNQDIIDKNEK